MAGAVNFLPWRQHRRQRCLRFWTLCCAGAALSIAAVVFCLRVQLTITSVTVQLWQQGDAALDKALLQREAQWKAFQIAQAQRQIRQKRRATTLRWQQTLSAIAQRLPPQTWLTRLNLQHKTLTLTGRAYTFTALKAVNALLHTMPGFRPGLPGNVGRDEQGRWQFSYPLIWEETDDAPQP